MDDRSATPPSLQTARTTLRRRAGRGAYDQASVFAIIDAALVCHVAFVADGVAMTLPTIHAREGDVLYLHGAMGNHMLKALLRSERLSVTFTLIDGLVFARSAFHHSVNYRSAVVFGSVHEVEDVSEKRRAMHALVERIAEGRNGETRPPTDAELRTTRVLRITIEEASAKVRSGPPVDDAEDLAGGAWAGELPLRLSAGPLRRDRLVSPEREPPPAVLARAHALGRTHEQVHEWSRADLLVSTDRARLDLELVHRFLSTESYWVPGLELARFIRALDASYCFGLYRGEQQLGFARVVSDGARFAWLSDVFVVVPARGQGLGKWLVECALKHPALLDVDRWMLGTRDAHELYARYGFEPDARPMMSRMRKKA